MPRYRVLDGSETGHCCFVATVVDTTRISEDTDRFYPVCECYFLADAEKIATALNATNN